MVAKRLERSHEHPDRFVRKWLQLRLNAFDRRRCVDERVTPAFLQKIDVQFCPVTRELLTHGTNSPTDWSVDRLNNDGAYAPGNLAVVSTRANKAKGARSFREVVGLWKRNDDTRLSADEWLRLATLMLGPSHAERSSLAPVLPLVAPIAPWTIATPTQVVQYLFTTAALTAATRNAMVRDFRPINVGDHARNRFERFSDVMRDKLKRASPRWDVWLDPTVMSAFVGWRKCLDANRWAHAGAMAMQLSRSRSVDRDELNSWHLPERGNVQ